ncbi:MAG: chalcone isomerase family protein [Oceanisphaera sp.]
MLNITKHSLIGLIWLLCTVPLAYASPVDDLQLVGQGEMDWLFFDLYEARFYSANGRYQAEQLPQALSLRYQRSIDSHKLVEATISEWQRLGVRWQYSWQQALESAWPSVQSGDQLTLRVNADGTSHFYFNGDLLTQIDDQQFGPAFLAIWLDDNSRKPKLTQQLKGN